MTGTLDKKSEKQNLDPNSESVSRIQSKKQKLDVDIPLAEDSKESDINKQDEYGSTALYDAANEGDLLKVQALLKQGAKVDIQNKLGESALIIAVIREHIDIARELLSSGANPNLPDNDGYTSLHHAALSNNLEMIKLLNDYDGDITIVLHDGSTIMHCVAVGVTQKKQDWELTKWLLSNGAPYMKKDENGYSEYDEFCSTDWSYAEKYKEIAAEILGDFVE